MRVVKIFTPSEQELWTDSFQFSCCPHSHTTHSLARSLEFRSLTLFSPSVSVHQPSRSVTLTLTQPTRRHKALTDTRSTHTHTKHSPSTRSIHQAQRQVVRERESFGGEHEIQRDRVNPNGLDRETERGRGEGGGEGGGEGVGREGEEERESERERASERESE